MRRPGEKRLDDRAADLPAAERAELVLIIREALGNVIRHSGASRADVRLDADADAIQITVRDDGRGFDPSAPRSGGDGLSNMRARAASIGGRLNVRSSPGSGTVVEIAVPRRGRRGEDRGEASRAPAHR